MGFNAEQFKNAELAVSERDVDVPKLAAFFDDEEEPVWRVRGLTAEQSAIASEAQQRNKKMETLLNAVISATGKEQSEAIKSAVGLGDELPDDIVRRIEMLIHGSVSPECDRDTAIKIGTYFPTVFFQLTNAILELTGEGANVLGKPKGSTGKQT